jgi:predicted transcriptional regulator
MHKPMLRDDSGRFTPTQQQIAAQLRCELAKGAAVPFAFSAKRLQRVGQIGPAVKLAERVLHRAEPMLRRGFSVACRKTLSITFS